MDYTISKGLPIAELPVWLTEAAQRLGSYPDGRVNYSKASEAPIVMTTVSSQNKVLLLKRSDKVGDAQGYWSIVNGFIDKNIPVKEVAVKEISEELQVVADSSEIKAGVSYRLRNKYEKRAYIVFPCLLSLPRQPQITLDQKHIDYRWVDRSEVENFHILTDLPYAIDQALALL